MPPPPEESAPALQQRIVTAARRHFMAHGFRSVTMDDLAAELAMSKKTLYGHFTSKAVLLEAVLRDKLRELDADLGAIASGAAADFPGALPKLLACLRKHTEELQPAFVRDMGREAPELFQRVKARRRELIQRHFGKLLGEGRKAGMIRKDITLELMIETLLGAADALMNPQKLSELGIPAQACLSAIITIFLQGVVTEPARRGR